MAYVDWMIRGTKLAACNCTFGCPCEFNGLPNNDVCEGLECMQIEEGWFGDVRLDGVRMGASFRWPGPVHLGGGEAQGYIDDSADEAQREAIIKILSGEEQDPNTVFNIYGSTIATEHELVFAPIEYECDVEARTGRFSVPGVVEFSIKPIANPVTGEPHRAQISLPDGWEFRLAEVANASFSGTAEIKYRHADCYGNLYRIAYGPHGIIE